MKIYRPVSMPQKFMGAPLLPGIFCLFFSVFSFLFLIFYDFGINSTFVVVGFLGSMIGGHMILIMIGSKEPHLTTLIQTMRFSLHKARQIGRPPARRFWP